MNIKDIAKLANVGVGTVSRVINGQTGVKESTRDRVQSIIEEYDYVPNTSARNLKRSKSLAIGVLIRGESNPFLSDILYSIEHRLRETPYKIVVHYLHSDDQDEVVEAERFIVEWKLKGLICLGGSYENVNQTKLDRYKIPIVFSSVDDFRMIDHERFGVIGIDNVETSYQGTRYLVALGHKNIGLISAKEERGSIGKQRRNGYEKALYEARIPIDDQRVVKVDYSMESGYQAMKALTSREVGLTAVFATTDELAIGALRYLHEVGRDDIDILGFDGLEIGEYAVPSLTTMEQPAHDIGKATAELLIRMFEEHVPTSIILSTRLIERESTRRKNESCID